MLSKIDLARTWHHQLDVEVNDIRQAIPLINEKVSSELVTITAVDDALKETEHELMLSRAKNADTLDKCTRANQRAGTERDEIRGEIEKETKLFNKITSVLLFFQFLCTVFIIIQSEIASIYRSISNL
jgi:hypothetical protein